MSSELTNNPNQVIRMVSDHLLNRMDKRILELKAALEEVKELSDEESLIKPLEFGIALVSMERRFFKECLTVVYTEDKGLRQKAYYAAVEHAQKLLAAYGKTVQEGSYD